MIPARPWRILANAQSVYGAVSAGSMRPDKSSGISLIQELGRKVFIG